MITRIALVLLIAASLTISLQAGEPRTLVVNTTLAFDESEATLTLPEAVDDLNLNGPDGSTILFNIPGPGPYRIELEFPLVITRPMTISGATQPGYAGTPVIQVYYDPGFVGDARNAAVAPARSKTLSTFEIFLFTEEPPPPPPPPAPAAARAAEITGSGVTLRALSITGPFTGDLEEFDIFFGEDTGCVVFQNGGGHVVESCYIGVAPDGSLSGSFSGLIAGEDVESIRVGSAGPGPALTPEANVFGGNLLCGVLAQCQNMRLAGNRVGVLPNGAACPNLLFGVLINAFGFVEETNMDVLNNVISNNGEGGLLGFIDGAGVIQGNRITGNGFNPLGLTEGELRTGIYLVDSTNVLIGTNGDGTNDAAEGNIISGNGYTGITIVQNGFPQGSAAARALNDPLMPVEDVRIAGNFIGVDSDGSALPNGGFNDPESEFDDDFPRSGIYVIGTPLLTIGTDLDGSAGDANEGNVISSNTQDGVLIESNFRMSAVAARALPAGFDIKITGNKIGTTPDGVTARGNGRSGVFVDNISSVLVGGTPAGAGNLIANNANDGVTVVGDSGVTVVTILGNSITANNDRGIDLGDDGLTANDPNSPAPEPFGDPDTGPNGFSNFPVLATLSEDRRTVSGTLNSDVFGSETGTVYRVEFFSNPDSSPDQGQRFLGSTDVTITDLTTFTAAFTATLTTPGVPGSTLSATATRLDEFAPETSEFYAPEGARLRVPALAFASDPTFTPPNPLVGETVTFSANATLSGITITWDFGDGSSATGATVTHPYGGPGVYTVTVTLLDAPTGASVTATLQVPVTAPATPSTPTTPSTLFRVRDLSIVLNADSGRDSIIMKGLLNLPKNLVAQGQTFDFNIGGVQQSFTLNKRGRARVGANSLTLARFSQRGKRNQDASFTLSMKRGSFTTPLKTGALNPDGNGLPGTITVKLRFNGQDYTQVVPVKFSGSDQRKSAKFGRF